MKKKFFIIVTFWILVSLVAGCGFSQEPKSEPPPDEPPQETKGQDLSVDEALDQYGYDVEVPKKLPFEVKNEKARLGPGKLLEIHYEGIGEQRAQFRVMKAQGKLKQGGEVVTLEDGTKAYLIKNHLRWEKDGFFYALFFFGGEFDKKDYVQTANSCIISLNEIE